ncbi:prophage antirepressor-like protein [Cytobacillus horneckiae]|uniref:ORF6C domain-containing protein n=1 Tax=Cytobacillus horneckiae TaxID=549687 RepID=UPI001F155AC6|nr:ORF6C domain-containing protein [Cytobacillus horneckiae]
MNQLTNFNHTMFGELPVIIINDTEWFGATEAAKALSFSRPHDAISNHVESEDSAVHAVLTNGGNQDKKFINESGLYSLIIGAAKQGNNKEIRENAKKFKRWVTSEVLPSIRKTGKYEAPASELQVLQQTVNQLVKMDGRVSYLEDHMRIDGVQEKKLQNKGKSVAIESLGGMKTVAYKEISRKVFTAIWRDFKNHFEIPRYNELPKKQFSEAMKFLSMWQPSTSLRIEIQELNNQMSIQEVI